MLNKLKRSKKKNLKINTKTGDNKVSNSVETPSTVADDDMLANEKDYLNNGTQGTDKLDETNGDIDDSKETDPVSELRKMESLTQKERSTNHYPTSLDVDDLSLDAIKNFRKTGRALRKEDFEREQEERVDDDEIMMFRSMISQDFEEQNANNGVINLDNIAAAKAYDCCGILSLK